MFDDWDGYNIAGSWCVVGKVGGCQRAHHPAAHWTSFPSTRVTRSHAPPLPLDDRPPDDSSDDYRTPSSAGYQTFPLVPDQMQVDDAFSGVSGALFPANEASCDRVQNEASGVSCATTFSRYGGAPACV